MRTLTGILVGLLIFCEIVSASVDEEREERNFDIALKLASEFLLSGVNLTANPCEDFFNFTCGSWMKKVYEQKKLDEEFYVWTLQIYKLLLAALKSAKIRAKRHEVPDYVKWTITFYDQCLAQDTTTNAEKLLAIFDHVKKVAPILPILDSSQAAHPLLNGIWEILGKFHRHFPASILFETEITQIVLQCDQERYTLKFKPVQERTTVIFADVVHKYVQQLGQVLNVTIINSEINVKVQNLIKFSTDLRNLIKSSSKSSVAKRPQTEEENEDEEDPTDNVYSPPTEIITEKVLDYEALKALNVKFKWDDFFKGLMSPEQLEKWNITHSHVVVVNEEYFQELQNVLDKHSPDTVFNYAILRVMATHYASLTGDTETLTATRGADCLALILKHFSSAAARMIFDKNKWNIVDWRSDLELFFETIRGAFKFLVSSADWLDYEDKMNVIKKVNFISFHSGIPVWLTNDTEINKRTFEFDSKRSITENTLNIATKAFNMKIDQVVTGTIGVDTEPNFEVNAFYSNMYIEAAMGHVLPPVYHPSYPMGLKYGNLGWVLGHELLHAFDENHVDELPPKMTRLFKAESRRAYDRKKACLKKQLYSYCYQRHGQCISGKNTLAETMADIDGMKIAYMAYKFSANTLSDDPPITGLTSYNGDKIFFMTAGRSYCTSNKNLQRYLGTEEEHAPSQPRLRISIRNFRTFAKVFGCVMGSTEVPMKACTIWGNYYATR